MFALDNGPRLFVIDPQWCQRIGFSICLSCQKNSQDSSCVTGVDGFARKIIFVRPNPQYLFSSRFTTHELVTSIYLTWATERGNNGVVGKTAPRKIV